LFLNLSGIISDAQAQQVQVTAADPTAAAQGTINLNVKVTGKGFKNGAQAKWFVTGSTDPGGVTVNSTAFVSSTELSANITVADTAIITNFDIQVLNSDGRGGKGTELFAVTAKGTGNGTSQTVSLRVSFEPAMSDLTACAVCGDGLGDYVDGVDGVSASLSRYGHLGFYFHGGDASPRRVLFNYSDFYPLPNHPAPDSSQLPNGPQSYGELVTFNAFTPYTPTQDMHVGDAPQCLMTGWTIGQGSPVWNNNYHRDGTRFFDSQTSYVVVTCVEQDGTGQCTKWELQPIASGCNSGTVATLANVLTITSTKKSSTYADYGLWKTPFKLTLSRN
jgi:hypothetical protein